MGQSQTNLCVSEGVDATYLLRYGALHVVEVTSNEFKTMDMYQEHTLTLARDPGPRDSSLPSRRLVAEVEVWGKPLMMMAAD